MLHRHLLAQNFLPGRSSWLLLSLVFLPNLCGREDTSQTPQTFRVTNGTLQPIVGLKCPTHLILVWGRCELILPSRKSNGFKWSLKSSVGGATLAAAVPDKFLLATPPREPGARPPQEPHHDRHLETRLMPNMQFGLHLVVLTHSIWWDPSLMGNHPGNISLKLRIVKMKIVFFGVWQQKGKFKVPRCEKERWEQGALEMEGRLGEFRERGNLAAEECHVGKT